MSLDRLIDEVLSSPPSRGRRASTPLMATIKRQLDRADIEALWQNPTSPTPSQRVSPIQRIRTSHHMLAKLIAEGRKGPEIQMITGYSSSYICNIQHEPVFAELVTYYRSQLGEVYLNVHQRLASLGLDVVDELQDRLNTDPDQFSIKDLEEVGKLTLDRAGYGPQSTVNHRGAIAMVTPEQLQRIKSEIERNQTGRTIPLQSQNDRGPALGSVIDGEPVAETKAEGQPSEGNHVPEQSGETDQKRVL